MTTLTTRPPSVRTTYLPHVKEYTSIEDKLVALALDTHALYHKGNADVYFSLEKATRGCQYAFSLNPFQQVKNDRGSLASIKQQIVRADKWQIELFPIDKFLHSAEWKGCMLYPLERFVGQHRGVYISMKETTEHDPFHLPNKFRRVGFLLAAIK
eukprot:513934-Ditylum_brightwellii.AAC.1